MLNININLLVEYSIFYNCSVIGTFEGGLIYFYCTTGGASVFYKCCISYCFTSNNKRYQFGYIYTKNSKINQIIDSSCSKCSNSIHLGQFDNLRIHNGNQIFNYNNFSNNLVNRYSSINFENPNSSISNYCTFFNNSVLFHTCVYFSGGINQRYMFKANIIHNNSPKDYGVVILWEVSANFSIQDSIFYDNYDILFYVYQGKLYLKNNFIYNFNKIYNGTIIKLNNIESKTNSFNILYFSTFNCYNKLNSSLIFKIKVDLYIYLFVFFWI